MNYEVDDFKTAEDIESLSKEYKGFSIDKIKFVYSRLLDYNLCNSFLEKYYSNTRVISQKVELPKPKVNKKSSSNGSKKSS